MKKIYLFFAIVALAFSYASAAHNWALNWWDGTNPFGNATVDMNAPYSGKALVFPDESMEIVFDTPVTIPAGFGFKVVPTGWGDGQSYYMTNTVDDVVAGKAILLTSQVGTGNEVKIKSELTNIQKITLAHKDNLLPHLGVYITFHKAEVPQVVTDWHLVWWNGQAIEGSVDDGQYGKKLDFKQVDPKNTSKFEVKFNNPQTFNNTFEFKVFATGKDLGNATVSAVNVATKLQDAVGKGNAKLNGDFSGVTSITLDVLADGANITFVKEDKPQTGKITQWVFDVWDTESPFYKQFQTLFTPWTTAGKAQHYAIKMMEQADGSWAVDFGKSPITLLPGKNMFAVIGLEGELGSGAAEHWYQNGSIKSAAADAVINSVSMEAIDIEKTIEGVSKIVLTPAPDGATVSVRLEVSKDVQGVQSDYWLNTWTEGSIPNNTYFMKYPAYLRDNIVVIYNEQGFKVGPEGQHFTIKSNGLGEFGGAQQNSRVEANTPVVLDGTAHEAMILSEGTYYRIYFNTDTHDFIALTNVKENTAGSVEEFNSYQPGDIVRMATSFQPRYELNGTSVISTLRNTGGYYDAMAVDKDKFDQADWIKLDKILTEGVYSGMILKKGQNPGEATLLMEGKKEAVSGQREFNTFSVYNFDQSWFTSNGYKEENVVDPRKFEKLVVNGYYYNDGQNDYCIGFPSQFNGEVKVPMTEQNILKVKLTNVSGLTSCFPNPANAPYYQFEGWFDGTAVNVTLSKELQTSVEDVESASKAVVIGGVGQISVLNAENVQVYTIGGALIGNSAETQCAPGVYVVRADNTVVKVVVK